MGWVAFIVTVIVFSFVMSDINKQNKRLRKKVKELEQRLNGEIVGEDSIFTQVIETVHETPVVNSILDVVQEQEDVGADSISVQKEKPKSEYSAKGIKNTLILISGAVFIILAAIVFLLSTWNHLPNVLKLL